ncbi:HAD family hydrolase [Dorea sp.]|nr:HAD family hydrolase [uncultured Dorea sp.]
MKGIIFDVDGTLWDSTAVAAVSWNKVIKDEGIEYKELDEFDLKKEFGKPMEAIGKSLFPDMPEDEMMALLVKMLKYENELVATGPCVIFDGVKETIKKLSEKYPLYIVSNCQDGYIEAFLQNSKLGEYFKDFTCPAYTGKLKGENIRIIMERNGLDEAVYVGDTQGDANACREAGIPMIFASYGFGEVEGEYTSIQKFEQLLNIELFS